MHIRFNQSPKEDIIEFLSSICIKENLNITKEKLESIQSLFKSDIRSMINYIQSNQHNITNNSIISHSTWEKLTISIKNKDKYNENKSISLFYDISNEYNIKIKH